MLRYSELPEKIPCHFGFTGYPDAWGHKAIIWLVPGASLLVLIAMAWISWAMADSGGQVALDAIRRDIQFLWLMAVSVSVVMLITTERMIAVARKHAERLGWQVFVALGLMVIAAFVLAPR